jgi:hypothetical protein
MILIVVGTEVQLDALRRRAEPMKPHHHGR